MTVNYNLIKSDCIYIYFIFLLTAEHFGRKILKFSSEIKTDI